MAQNDMTTVFHKPATDTPSGEVLPVSVVELDTIAGSVVHHFFGYLDRIGLGGVFALLNLYIIAVALTFLPLLVGALLSPFSLTVPGGVLRLPFFCDLNVLFMFLVSFPCLVILSVTDQQVLANSLKSIQFDRTITISESDATLLAIRWKKYFRSTNLIGQALGIVVGALIAYINYLSYTPAKVGFWIAYDDSLLPVGFVYLFCIFLFYALIPVYVIRSVAISLLLRDIVSHSQLHLLPLHPDKSGGLRPIGRLGLRNQYLLTLLGLNVVLFVTIYHHHLIVPDTLQGLMAAAVIAYLILGPVVFIAPLLPFRGGMLKSKCQLMGEVAQRLRIELDRLLAQLQSGSISKEDEELIERLRKIGAVIDELPVWPFDAGTLRKFLTAYVIPIISTIGIPAVKAILNFAKVQLHF